MAWGLGWGKGHEESRGRQVGPRPDTPILTQHFDPQNAPISVCLWPPGGICNEGWHGGLAGARGTKSRADAGPDHVPVCLWSRARSVSQSHGPFVSSSYKTAGRSASLRARLSLYRLIGVSVDQIRIRTSPGRSSVSSRLAAISASPWNRSEQLYAAGWVGGMPACGDVRVRAHPPRPLL